MSYDYAKQKYFEIGVDTARAMEALYNIPISMHCWQGDDVKGFEDGGANLTGGIQATGSYPGRARNFDELTAMYDRAFSLIPGKHRVNLHAIYAVTDANCANGRDELTPRHFEAWLAYAKARGLGIDFNPTFFSHEKAGDSLTLSSPNPDIREFWIAHAKACREIAAYFARELSTHCLYDVWVPDGYKDIPADMLSPRQRLKNSLDQIFGKPLEGVIDCVEGKVFGIGLESATVGSHEFYIAYCAARRDVYPLIDNGHFHPTESAADKISALLPFFDKIPLHITRPVRWDSDHVVRLDGQTQAIANEIIKTGANAYIGLDYFDASINRVAAWVIGMRNTQKALLTALLTPWDELKKLQNTGDFTRLIAYQEELKTYPIGIIWDEFCKRHNVPIGMQWMKLL